VTQEFHISVTPVGQNDYLVRTEQVAPGVPLAEELVTWPVTEWLVSAGHLMNDPLKSVFEGRANPRKSLNLVTLGQQLYNALFQGTLRDSWITAQGIAQNHQKLLHLRLGLKDVRLARLPWEVMHAGDRPLATGPYIAFSRYQSGTIAGSRLPLRSRSKVPETGKVKVLMVLASPPDQVRLDLLKQEAINLQEELHRQKGRTDKSGHHLPEISLTILDQPGREELTQALEQGKYQILHYSGHSSPSPQGGQIYLVSRRTGLTETLTGDDLAGLLVNNNIKMVVFNSCWGAYTATSDPGGDTTAQRNLTESLVKRGIGSILAMSERIPDEVALTLTQLFYHKLSQGYPVDLCVNLVRQGLISAYGSHQNYWALPILYLQQDFDGSFCPEISVSAENLGADSLREYTHQPRLRENPTSIYLGDDTDIGLPIDEMISCDVGDDSSIPTAPNLSDVDWLGEDTWGDLVDEIESDDPDYEEDSALVSDLFRQLNQEIPHGNPVQGITNNRVQEYHLREDAASEDGELKLSEETLESLPPAAKYVGKNRNTPAPGSSSSQAPSLPLAPTRYLLWLIMGIVGVSALCVIILWFFPIPKKIVKPAQESIFDNSPTQDIQPEINLKHVRTEIITTKAKEKLRQGDLKEGLRLITELLNRDARIQAEASLDLVPQNQLDNSSVNFLKGRLAWQFVQAGNQKYSINDVRRYWESALESEPNSPLYNNALGFAYYAQGNLNQANSYWFQALNLALNEQKIASTAPVAISTELPEAALTSYAGLALGLYTSASNQVSINKKIQYVNEAIKLRDMVIANQPVDFEINPFSPNWLSGEKALERWRSLLQEKAGEN
jgi:tetratricopeptide (TPR) repeat protein